MGYTRYFKLKGKLDTEKFNIYSKTCQSVCEEIQKEEGYVLVGQSGEEGTDPIFEDDTIAFNGCNELSHEDFFISPNCGSFNFTKTNRKPYDSSVCACLILAKNFFGNNIEVSSDGDNGDEKINLIISKHLRDIKIEEIVKN